MAIFRIITCFIFLILINNVHVQGQQSIKVTLLGTGTTSPIMERFGPSILVEAGARKFLFDAGRGSLQRLKQINVKFNEIDGVFFTHLHSDHVVGFPDLWLTGWLTDQRTTPLQVRGPKGTKKMTANLEKAFEFDIKFRISDNKAAPDGVVIEAKDVKEGVIYEKDGVKITAFDVDHFPVKPAFGYRIDYAGHSVVLSGDTRYSENLIKFAKGVDLLIHEVVAPETLARLNYSAERAAGTIGKHTTPKQAGQLFSVIKPKMAIFSHIVPPTATEQEIFPATRKNYTGAVELGEDLMVIEVGESVVISRLFANIRE